MSGDARGGAARRPRKLERSQAGPGALRELKYLLSEAYLAADAPTLDEITVDIAADGRLDGAPSRDTVRRCISSPDVPAGQADTVAVAVVLARRAAWDGDNLAIRVRGLWIQAHMTVPPGKPVAEFTDPFALEVHRAIDTRIPPDGTTLPVLPAFRMPSPAPTSTRWPTRPAAIPGSVRPPNALRTARSPSTWPGSRGFAAGGPSEGGDGHELSGVRAEYVGQRAGISEICPFVRLPSTGVDGRVGVRLLLPHPHALPA